MHWNSINTTTAGLWTATLEDGSHIEWKGFGVGPLVLTDGERAALCQRLLGIPERELQKAATGALHPVQGTIEKSLILHSTTTDLGAFPGDLAKLLAGVRPKNYAGYVETRAPFLGKAGDLAAGRMEGWKISAAKAGVDCLDIPNLSHYYLSDVLLLLAAEHLNNPQPSIQALIGFLKKYPQAVVRLYVLDKSFQLFLTWLQRQTGLDKINIDANSPEVAAIWNNKNILYPTVADAKKMNIGIYNSPYQILEAERRETLFKEKLGLELPGLPGYVIQRKGRTLADFSQQVLDAAQLLQSRYGLVKGCLKACESGDGGRITPNIDLSSAAALEKLAETAYPNGDDYVLESHVNYAVAPLGKGTIKLSPSAHIRSGALGEGITLQFTEGASWVGNLYVNEQLAPQLGIPVPQYRTILQTVDSFRTACQQEYSGLAIGGFDFAIGQVGGKFGTDMLLGVQDPNISFNGAEFLREFMKRACDRKGWTMNSFFAATWVFVPLEICTHDALEAMLRRETSAAAYSVVVAVVPNFWAMIGVAALEYPVFVSQLERLQEMVKGNYSQ